MFRSEPLADTNLTRPPCLCGAPAGDLSFPRVLHASGSSGGLSGFVHQAPAVDTEEQAEVTDGDRAGQRESSVRGRAVMSDRNIHAGRFYFERAEMFISSFLLSV